MKESNSFSGITNFLAFLIISLFWTVSTTAQESGDLERPTVETPVLIDFKAVDETVSPGQSSAFVITFKVPKHIWLGAEPALARTPPGTKIRFKKNDNFIFGEPRYPEPSVEGVPVRVGLTNVYKGEVTVIVPFTVKETAVPGEQEITTLLTYTPGFDAGKLNTVVNDPHTVKLKISPTGSTSNEIPEPGVKEVSDSFTIAPEVWNLPKILQPFMKEYEEGTATSELLHDIFLDPENHGKTLRQAIFPFAEYTLQRGQSIGMGIAVLNATPEGVMTGALSASGYFNEFIGATGSVIMLTCPAAYHNLQTTFEYSGTDYHAILVNYENFTLGKQDKFGFHTNIDISSDPRFLFYGIGAGANDEDAVVYDHQNIGGVFDFYFLGIEKFRVGAGFKYRKVEVDQGLRDIDGDPFGVNGYLPLLTSENFDNPALNVNATTLGGRLNFIYDQRNQEFNPTSGFFGKVTAEYNSITDAGNNNIQDNYTKLYLDFRKYFSGPSQKLTFLIRNEWVFSTEKDIPFYELSSLGGISNIRAFDINRFRDQHSFFASMEMRYTVAKVTVMGFPMAMIMGGFLDMGQVFNDDVSLDFENNFNWAPGVSLRLVNYPNVGYTINVARGQDGIYTSGGISLPF